MWASQLSRDIHLHMAKSTTPTGTQFKGIGPVSMVVWPSVASYSAGLPLSQFIIWSPLASN